MCNPSTVFWTANAQNARGQITQDTLGNGIVRTRAFDAITGWLASIQAGPSGNMTALQNTSYLYDLVGNVTQRQNNRLSLTENFYYGNSGDNLYRLGQSTLTFNGTTTTNLSLTYDALGNILTKNEAGTHDLPVAQSTTWTSYNYPASITATTTGETAAFSYGPDRQRWKMVFSIGSSNETTYYIGGLMEKVITGSLTDYRYYIKVGGEPIAIYSRTSASQNTVRYVLSDHQGSIDTVAISPNTRVIDESFTAYGLRRNAATWSGEPSSGDRALADGITREGYTFQTVLGRMGLNHMNGRVQDAVIGRFISPDPFVTEPGNTQNFNRYAYVYNNPLTYVDPSGFETLCFEPSKTSSYGSTASNSTPSDPNHVVVDGKRDNQVCVNIPDLPNVGQPGNNGGSGGGGPGSGGGGSFDPSSIPVPTLARIDIYDPCGALDEHLADLRERAQDMDRLRNALRSADISATSADGILRAASTLPMGAQLVGVTAPSGWVWLHPSAGVTGPIMPSHGNVLLNQTIRGTAGTTLRYVGVAGVGIDGLQVGYEIAAGNYDLAAYNAADAAISAAAIKYFKAYGAAFSVAFKMAGGTNALVKAGTLSGLVQACTADSGVYIP